MVRKVRRSVGFGSNVLILLSFFVSFETVGLHKASDAAPNGVSHHRQLFLTSCRWLQWGGDGRRDVGVEFVCAPASTVAVSDGPEVAVAGETCNDMS